MRGLREFVGEMTSRHRLILPIKEGVKVGREAVVSGEVFPPGVELLL